MNKVTVSAPGKLMLFGEHAAVFQKPCIVTAVGQRIKATIELTNTSAFQLEAPDVHITNYKKLISELGKGNIPKGAIFVEIAIKNFLQRYSLKGGIKVTTKSEFSSSFGFGSSSAVTVCVVKALSELLQVKLTNRELFDLAYKVVLDVQKKGSGFDVAAAIYGGTLYFIIGGKAIEPLTVSSLPLIIGYSGVKADTVTVINQVLEKTKENPQVVNKIYYQIGVIVEKAKKAIEKEDWKTTGELMDKNQLFLRELGVSTQKLDVMIAAAKNAGAYGAKLSGAGGGDCMVAICSDDKRKDVTNAIEKIGGQVIDITVNAEGVKVEV